MHKLWLTLKRGCSVKDNKGLQLMASNNTKLIQQQQQQKTVKGHTKNVLFNMDVIKKEEGERTTSMLYDNWMCTNVNKLCGQKTENCLTTTTAHGNGLIVGTIPQLIMSGPRQAQVPCQLEETQNLHK